MVKMETMRYVMHLEVDYNNFLMQIAIICLAWRRFNKATFEDPDIHILALYISSNKRIMQVCTSECALFFSNYVIVFYGRPFD